MNNRGLCDWMCRCINGGCEGEQCQCHRNNQKCIDCWCVLCENRDQSRVSTQIVLEVIEEVRYVQPPPAPIRQSQPSYQPVFSNRSSASSYTSTYYCGCGVSKCAKGNCGCRKRSQKCKQFCGCPPDCQNQKQSYQQRNNVIQPHNPRPINANHSNLFPTVSSFPSLVNPQPLSRPQQIIVPAQLNPVQPLFPYPSPPPINSISSPNRQIQSLTASINNLNFRDETKSNRCCPCSECNKNCKCFRAGDCCTNCHKTSCLNLDLELGDISIPNYIKS